MERHILVVDDEVRMADSLRTLLEDTGYQVEVAYSGEQALEKLRQSPPELVVTDIKMSEVDGYDVMRFIRDSLPQTYVIVITGHADLDSAIEAIHQKAFDYITKPFDFKTLLFSIEKAFNQLETERFREDMISMLTHDIRVPLQSIIGYASAIYARKTGKFHQRSVEFVRNVCIYSQRVLALLDNFLTSCKIEAGKLVICETQFDVNYFVSDLISILELTAEKRGIRIEFHPLDESRILSGDESLLFRAVSNIVNNAIKYSYEEGTVHIGCDYIPEGESPLNKEAVSISVKNHGPGIPPEELPHVFERYKRAHNLRTIEGSGLGLFVVKSVVEAHQGSVEVESIPDNTTTVRLILPLRQHTHH